MNANELKKLMLAYASEKATEYTASLSELPPQAKTERRALMIQKRMAEHCMRFLKFDFDGKPFSTRENIIFVKSNMFKEHKGKYDILDQNGREMFLTFAYPMMMVMGSSYLPRKQLLQKETDAEKIFESKIVVGTLGDILGEWQRLWNEHGSMDCEVL